MREISSVGDFPVSEWANTGVFEMLESVFLSELSLSSPLFCRNINDSFNDSCFISVPCCEFAKLLHYNET